MGVEGILKEAVHPVSDCFHVFGWSALLFSLYGTVDSFVTAEL